MLFNIILICKLNFFNPDILMVYNISILFLVQFLNDKREREKDRLRKSDWERDNESKRGRERENWRERLRRRVEERRK